mgnify:CR=1 FL=1
MTGAVVHSNGTAYGGVAIGVWSAEWRGAVTTSEPNGKFEIPLNNVPPGSFHVAVVKLETCGHRDGDPTARDCERLSNVVDMVTTAHCQGDGAVQVTEMDFVGP